jgi:hypothetical protein
MVHTTEQWQNGGDHRMHVDSFAVQISSLKGSPVTNMRTAAMRRRPIVQCVIQHCDTLTGRARNAHIFTPQTD